MFFYDEIPFRSPPKNVNENKNLTRVKVHVDLSILVEMLEKQESLIRALHAELKRLQRQKVPSNKSKAKTTMR
ncbi:hypothetical protein JQC72_13785 [Polycladomyces sp. WAk]|uniref:Uncharacterized protein n=1 Tax=Polycladomyces zharkentensis TaxID=2807616 RepID=A0ABS2WM18_9BACL|nr:hypothetical protein [Polycladomyces sp. WAk]MBN2910573.1 hypothetical protein [Polycladomyces sp. WAk]